MKKSIEVFLIILIMIIMAGCDKNISIKLNDNTVNFKLPDIWETKEKVDVTNEDQCWIPIFFKGKTEKWEALGSAILYTIEDKNYAILPKDRIVELKENREIEIIDCYDETKNSISSYWVAYYDLASERYVYEMIFHETEKDVFFSFHIEVLEEIDVGNLQKVYESVRFS